MLRKSVLICILSFCIVDMYAQTDWFEWEENTLEAEDISYWQEKYEELSELMEHPLISIQLPRNSWSHFLFFLIK